MPPLGLFAIQTSISTLWNKKPYPIKRFVGKTASRTFLLEWGQRRYLRFHPNQGTRFTGSSVGHAWDGMGVQAPGPGEGWGGAANLELGGTLESWPPHETYNAQKWVGFSCGGVGVLCVGPLECSIGMQLYCSGQLHSAAYTHPQTICWVTKPSYSERGRPRRRHYSVACSPLLAVPLAPLWLLGIQSPIL